MGLPFYPNPHSNPNPNPRPSRQESTFLDEYPLIGYMDPDPHGLKWTPMDRSAFAGVSKASSSDSLGLISCMALVAGQSQGRCSGTSSGSGSVSGVSG